MTFIADWSRRRRKDHRSWVLAEPNSPLGFSAHRSRSSTHPVHRCPHKTQNEAFDVFCPHVQRVTKIPVPASTASRAGARGAKTRKTMPDFLLQNGSTRVQTIFLIVENCHTCHPVLCNRRPRAQSQKTSEIVSPTVSQSFRNYDLVRKSLTHDHSSFPFSWIFLYSYSRQQ